MRFLVIALFFVFSYALEVNILKVEGDKAVIDADVLTGVSGVVICKYKNEPIICARAVTFGNQVKFYNFSELKNDAFALPYVVPKKGDKIILGKNYHRILIIAPDVDTYINVSQMYQNETIISPDIFAPFIDDVPTQDDFRKFCEDFNIGRIIFVLDKIYEVDSFSFYALRVKNEKLNPHYTKAFFTTYPSFDITGENFLNYYKSMIKH